MIVKKLIIHHSATEDGSTNDFNAIKQYHITTNGWKDIGYHFVIENQKGQIVTLKGRSETTTGAHTLGMNGSSLGICVVGNYDRNTPSEDRMRALVDLCITLCKKYKLRASDIEPHNKYATKTCPGLKFPMDELRKRVAERLVS